MQAPQAAPTEPELVDLLAVNEAGAIDLTAEEAGEYFLVTSDSSAKIADVTIGDGAYTINSTGAADDALTLVTIGAEDATVTTDIPAQIATGAGSGMFTVNDTVYVATESALTINVTAEGSSLIDGTVHLDSTGENAPESVVIGEQTITATGTELDVSALDGEAQTISDIDVGETFTIGEDSYEQTEIGLIKNNSQLLADSEGDDYTYDLTNDNWNDIVILEGDAINITSDTAEGTVFVNADKTARVATYEGGVLTAGDTEAAAAVTVSVDNGVDVNIGSGFGSIEAQVADEATGGFSLLKFIVNAIKQTASYFGIKFGSSGASVSVDGAEEIDLEEGTMSVEAGTTVSTLDEDGNVTNSVKVESDYTVGVTDEGIPSISGVEDLSGISVAGTATVDITPSATADTTYEIGSQEFTTRSKTEGNTLTFTLAGDSVDDGDTSTKVTAIDNLEQGATMTVVDSNEEEENTVAINDVEYTPTANSAMTVIGTIDEETGVLSSRMVDTGSYYVVIENNNAQVFSLIKVDDVTFTIDTEAGDLGFSAFSNDAAYGGDGSIVMKSSDTLLVPSKNNVIIVENRDSTPVNLSSANGDDYLNNLMNAAAYVVDGFTIQLVSIDGDTISVATEVPTEVGIVGIPYNMTLEVGELKIDNTNTDAANVIFGETLTLDGANVTVSGASDITFTLGGDAETSYTINGVVYTSATAEDTVAITEDGIVLTTTGDGMTATGEGTFVLVEGGIYTVNDDTFDVVADATIEDGMLVNGTVKIYDATIVNEKSIELSNDTDGIEVTVSDNELTSITKLTTGGKVEYDESTYEMTSDGRLKVTEANGEIKFYAGGEEVNILDPEGEAIAYEEVTEDGAIELTPEVLAKLAESGAVEFGTTDSDTGEITPLATLTEGEEGAYELASEAGMADATEPVAVDASGVDDMTSLTTDFDAAVTTPATKEPVKVNDTTYKSADGEPLTVAANADGTSTLSEGTVELNPEGENNAVTPTGEGEPAVEATAGDGITATVDSDGKLAEIGDIDDGDSFKVGDEEYTKAPAGLVSDGKILDNSGSLTSADPDALADSDTWAVMLALDENGALDLTDSTLTSNGEVTVVDSVDNPSKIYGSAGYEEGEEGTAFTFDVSGYADEIAAVKLGSADATLTIALPLQLKNPARPTLSTALNTRQSARRSNSLRTKALAQRSRLARLLLPANSPPALAIP